MHDDQIRTIDGLALILGGSGDSFTGDLLRLIAKADPGNRAQLRGAFPYHVRAWELWQSLPEPTARHIYDVLTGEDPGAVATQLPKAHWLDKAAQLLSYMQGITSDRVAQAEFLGGALASAYQQGYRAAPTPPPVESPCG